MNALTRLAAFAVALLVVFAAGWGIGAAVGPIGDEPTPVTHTDADHGDGG